MGDRNTDNQDAAEERTDLAEDRTVMAAERTFAGWLRTAFAAIGLGLAFHALFGEFDPPWLARAIASLFVAAGGALAYAAERRACRTLERLHAHKTTAPEMPNLRLLAWAVAAAAVILIAALWLLHSPDV